MELALNSCCGGVASVVFSDAIARVNKVKLQLDVDTSLRRCC
jgi:hypothetical protein